MEMRQYVGTKIIKATPMTLGEYNTYRGWKMPADEDGLEAGYLIEYADGHLNHRDSWSPKNVFDISYMPTTGMSFGLAIEAMKLGCKVSRKGWNGKGIFLRLSHPGMRNPMTEPFIYIDTTGLESNDPACAKCKVPWLASQMDMLATDWEIHKNEILHYNHPV